MSGMMGSLKELTEEGLLQVILASATSGQKNDFRLVPALDELSGRKFESRVSACRILLQVAGMKGGLEPETGLITKALSRICNEDLECLDLVVTSIQTPGRNSGVLVCVLAAIETLEEEKQNRLVSALIPILGSAKEDWDQARRVMDCLGSLNEASRAESAKNIDGYLESADPNEVYLYVSTARRLTRKENLTSILKVLDRSARGWYSPLAARIQDEACLYLVKIPDERAAPSLLAIFRQGVSQGGYRVEVANAIAAIANKPVADKLLDFIGEMLLEYSNNRSSNAWQVASNVTQVLAEVDPSVIDLERLLSFHELIGLGGSEYYLKQIVGRQGDSALPLLFGLLKSQEKKTYSFAAECLNQRGVGMDEMARVFDPPPVVQLVDYFFNDVSPSVLWRKKTELGPTLKGVGVNSFDFLVQNLLMSFNILTIYVDKSGKRGVDVVGISPSSLKLIVAGVTSGVPKDDLQKLHDTVSEMRKSMTDLLTRYDIISVLFTRVDSIHPADAVFANQLDIIILTAKDVEHLLEMSVTGRTANDLLEFFLEKRQSAAASGGFHSDFGS